MKSPSRVVEPVLPANLFRAMHEDHVALEGSLKNLIERSYGEDPAAIRDDFKAVEQELRAHLEVEERDMLPQFAQAHPAEAARVREEHALIRRRLDDLGLALELHVLRAGMVEDFVDLINRHAAHEELVMYRWSENALPDPEKRALFNWILARFDDRILLRRSAD